MKAKIHRGILLADFNIANLTALLNNDEDIPHIEATTGPYDQIIPVLIDANHHVWVDKPDFAVVWSRPSSVSAIFKQALYLQHVPVLELLQEVDDYCDIII